MKILTVILNYKTPQLTLDAISAAVDALDDTGQAWELLVVDNDSGDGSYETINNAVENSPHTSWQNVSVQQSPRNGGFGAGNNIGIRYGLDQDPPPDYIYILNSDAFPAKEAIKHLLGYLESHPDTGIAGSYIHGTDGTPHTTAFRFPSICSEFEGSINLGVVSRLFKNYVVPIGVPEQTTRVDWLAGASMMMRTSMLKQVGLFDETFFLYFEETDLCLRARRQGWNTVYVRESQVAHVGSASTGMGKWDRIPKYWLDSRGYYFRKNHGTIYAHMAAISQVTGRVIWELRKLIQNKNDNRPPGYLWDFIRHWLNIGR